MTSIMKNISFATNAITNRKRKLIFPTHALAKELPKAPVSFEITQSIGNTRVQRILPDVGFNIQNWSDDCLKAWIKVKVILGGRGLGLIKGSTRNSQYLGYYDGETPWNLNPNYWVFGHFTLPHECVDSQETLTLVVSTKFARNEKEFDYLPIAWTYMRKTNSWFIEPTGFLFEFSVWGLNY
jgi:hypothetical protein